MAQVTYANMFSESRNRVEALLTSTNVPDPTVSSAEHRKWIYSRDPDVKGSNFKGYPYLILHPADVGQDERLGSCNGKSKFVTWDIEIEIVTSDRGYGEKDSKGLSHMEAISDDILATFTDMTNRKTLSSNSMAFSKPVSTPVTTEVIQNELCFRRSIMLGFRSKIQVSA